MESDPKKLKSAFSANLKRARGNYTQAEFARMLDIPGQQTYQRYESGQIIPAGDVLHRIATRLGVTIDTLLSPEGKAEDTGVVLASPQSSKLAAQGDIPLIIPWGFENEQRVQFVNAISIFAQAMTPRQLMAVIKEIGNSSEKRFNKDSKSFWINVLGDWLIQKLELEEFKQLSPEEKKERIRERNEALEQKRKAGNKPQ